MEPSCKAIVVLQTLGCPDEALQCCVNAHSDLHMSWDNLGSPHMQMDVPPFHTGGSQKVLATAQSMKSAIQLQAFISKLLSVSRTFQGPFKFDVINLEPGK